MVLHMALFFSNRPRPNYSVDRHRDPIASVFFIGGIAGFIAAAHYAIVLAGGFTEVQMSQWMISGFAFSGMLSVGVYRMVQFNAARSAESLISALIRFSAGGAFASFLGALPLAFIDYTGAELIGFGDDTADFLRTIIVLVAIGTCLSLFIGFVITRLKPDFLHHAKRSFLSVIAASMVAGVCVVFFIFPLLKIYVYCYIVLFGCIVAFILFARSR